VESDIVEESFKPHEVSVTGAERGGVLQDCWLDYGGLVVDSVRVGSIVTAQSSLDW